MDSPSKKNYLWKAGKILKLWTVKSAQGQEYFEVTWYDDHERGMAKF